jgi:hypothetical protein
MAGVNAWWVRGTLIKANLHPSGAGALTGMLVEICRLYLTAPYDTLQIVGAQGMTMVK